MKEYTVTLKFKTRYGMNFFASWMSLRLPRLYADAVSQAKYADVEPPSRDELSPDIIEEVRGA